MQWITRARRSLAVVLAVPLMGWAQQQAPATVPASCVPPPSAEAVQEAAKRA
ncbi:MAG: hypothetical protein H0U68_03325, partial [Ramlibacter sp.]|nr:hypothetical protein [Ramlibacter sp.]